MEITNSAKAVAVRRRGGPQQGPQPASHHSFEPLKLERAYGSGSCTAAAIACPHPIIPGLLAYSCGAVVVLYDGQHKQQNAFLSPKPRRSLVMGKPYACLAFSRDGAYLAAGERSPQVPEILIWEVSSSRCLQSLKGHKHGIGSIAFSQDGRLLVSTGESYDGQLCVWDWQTGVLLARQHTQAEVQRACFAEELAAGASGLTITTVGKAGHFKVWSLTLPQRRSRDGHLAAAGQASLTPRPANLKEYRTSNFVGVAAAPADSTTSQALLYALTQSGVLLTLRPATRTIDKSLSLQVPAAFGLAVSPSLIACACAAGVVRLFAARTLAFKGNLPRPSTGPSNGRSTGGGHPEGPNGHGGSSGGGGTLSGPGAPGPDPMTSAGTLFADAVSCAFDSTGERLTVVYADRSLMVWDVRNPARVSRIRSVLSHAGVVWGAALIPAWQASLLADSSGVTSTPGDGCTPGESFSPSSVLCTCGADGTVRLWNVCLNNSASTAGPFGVPSSMASAAKVTRTLRAIIHAVTPGIPESGGGFVPGTAAGNRRYAPDAPLPVPGVSGGGNAVGGACATAGKPATLRCLRVSPCGRHLATGDARGNLRVFSLATLQLVMLKEAHDAEILSLDYSPPSLDGTSYLASGSRDTFVHVYDMSRGYELVGTCDIHGGAVTAVRFSAYGGRLALLSCSADKSVVFRLVQLASCGLSFEIYHTERMSRGVLYDMAVDPAGGRAVAVAQDNQLRLFDVATGRALRNFSGDPSCGEAVAVTMDASGHLAICSCADGSVAVYEIDAGTLLARGSGHSDVCTGAVLLEDHRGLVTVGGDGCALLWRLTPRLAQRMQDAAVEAQQQLEQQAAAQAQMLEQQRQHQNQQESQPQEEGHPVVTPAVRRRKAWNLGITVDGSNADIRDGGANAAGGDEGGEVTGEEPHQVQVDMSATLLRIREGKPLLSLEKLPKWAQRSYTPLVGAESDCGNPCYGAPDPGQPLVAGIWVERTAQSQQEQHQHPIGDTAGATEAGPTAGGTSAFTLPAPFADAAVAATTAAAAARASALAGEPRTWAEAVEEDDEIVFCDSLEDAQGPVMLVNDAQETAAEVEPDHTIGVKAIAQTGGAWHDRAGDDEQGRETGSGSQDAASREEDLKRGSPHSQPWIDGEPMEMDGEIPASCCASNRLGVGLPPQEDGATADGEAVRPRDLFREHFDSLGLDQASATKAPPQDPRRLSFTLMYRHARASSGAGGVPDAAMTPTLAADVSAAGASVAAAAVPIGGAAQPQAGAATREMPTTPFLSKLPLPPTVNAARGAAGVGLIASILDADGAVTSAAWTPERAMLPLMSPALAKTDKQLQELERIRLRLLSTLRKRQSNEEGALGAPPSTALVASPMLTAGRFETAALATAAKGAFLGSAGPLGQPGPAEQQPPRAEDAGCTAPTQGPPCVDPQTAPRGEPDNTTSRKEPNQEGAQSGGGFLLPPPPAYTPAGAITAGEQYSPDTPAAQTSPGFSSLTVGTPMMGQASAGRDITSPSSADQGANATGEDPNNRLFVFNPIYGVSPNTPVVVPRASLTTAMGLCKGLSPRSGGEGCDIGPACSPAGSDTMAAATDDVIRTVLESEGGAAVAVAGGGVCVVTKEVNVAKLDGKEQQAVPPPAASVPAGDSESHRGKLRRPKLALPAVKPKAGTSPAKPLNSLVATVAQALACQQAGAIGATGEPQSMVPISESDADALLVQMQTALRGFTDAYRRLIAAPPVAVSSSSAPGSAASRYQAAARGAVAELEALLTGQAAAQTTSKPQVEAGTEVPPALVCRSPQVSLDMSRSRRAQQGLSRIGRGFKSGLDASVSASAAGGSVPGSVSGSLAGRPMVAGSSCNSGSSHVVSASQIMVEVGLVESMVEEKLQQRMQEEMRRIEEAVMQRIMQKMQQQQL